jgi:branched-chain amino acid transport system substrate-binding protein
VSRALTPLLSLLLGLLVAGCQAASLRAVEQPTPSPEAVKPVVVGAILDVGRDGGPDGRQRLEAALLATELVNRRGGLRLPSGEQRPLELRVYDDAGDPERAELSLKRLGDDGAIAVIGPSQPESTLIVRRSAEEASIPLIALDEAGSRDSSRWHWTFTLDAPAEEALGATIDFFAASNVDRFAWMAPRTMEASSLRRVMLQLASTSRMQVVAEEEYPPGDEEYAPRLGRLQANDPRVILAWPRDATEAGAIAQEAAKVRDLVPVFLGPAAANSRTLAAAGDGAAVVRTVTLRLPVADDLWDHDPLTPVVRDFRREIQARTGRVATADAAGAWDAVRLIAAVVERVGPGRLAVQAALESTTDFLGVSGSITFNPRRHDGLDRRSFIVARSEGLRWRLPP